MERKVTAEDLRLDSIQWVIDKLDNAVIEKRLERENHKFDSVRTDQNLKWCPECQCKWEIYEDRLWITKDIKLWDAETCPDCKEKE